jgi:preprotein translocase subunit SecF
MALALNHMDFIKYRKIFYIIAVIIVIGSLVSLFSFGLKMGVDFTGGSILEVAYQNERPANQIIQEKLNGFNLGSLTIQPTGQSGVIIRMENIKEEIHQQILVKLSEIGSLEEKSFESVGPTVGRELANKTLVILALSLLSMMIYIAIAFSGVSRIVPSWKYGVTSALMLLHDVLVPLGVFAILGKFYGVQMTTPVVVALLSVVGYAINNVVVVFDRIRENLVKKSNLSFTETVNFAIHQTLSRQINTSLTILFPLFFIFFIGGDTLKYFALAIILGLLAGLYSSIFLAGQILVTWLGKRSFGLDK